MLLENGADPNALTLPPSPVAPSDNEEYSTIMAELQEEMGVDLPATIPEESPTSVLCVSMQKANLDKIELLLRSGANANFVDDHGYSVLLKACYSVSYRSDRDNEAIIKMLLDQGAREAPPTQYGESPVSVLSNQGNFDLLKLLLERGFDREKLNWTPLFEAIAFEDYPTVKNALSTTEDMEHRDSWDRTPFLLAAYSGRLDVVQLLASSGCRVDATGRCGATALEYSIRSDSVNVCHWLIENGSDVNANNEFGYDALASAVDVGSVQCAKRLVDAGADPFQECEYGFGLLHDTESVEMYEFLAEQGVNTSEACKELRLKLLGGTGSFLVSEQEYLGYRERRFGATNPEPMNNAFWDAQVNTRITAHQANDKFGKSAFDFSSPTWCCDRHGQSFTKLPDGRFVEIGGEHEDSYDPDFCIYNDVIVHNGHGNFTIYGYPESVFPPTDFHSATLVGNKIVIIGCLGYVEHRQPSVTPVFLLNCNDWSIEELVTSGEAPDWLNKHTAILLDESQIHIRGGKNNCDDNQASWVLDLQRRIWIRKQ